MSKIKLALPVLLLQIPDDRDQCVTHFLAALNEEGVIEKAHLKEGPLFEVCLHYAPNQLAIKKVKAIARRTGAKITRRYRHLIKPVPSRKAMHKVYITLIL
jgi:Cd2+/Zn2+-exporting ATPase